MALEWAEPENNARKPVKIDKGMQVRVMVSSLLHVVFYVTNITKVGTA